MAAKSQAASLEKGRSAAIRVILSKTTDFDLIAKTFFELGRAFSDFHITCERKAADDIVDHLRSGDAEIALAGPIDDTWSRLESRALFIESFKMVVRMDHRLAGKTEIDPVDLSSEQMIVRPYCETWSD